MNPSNRQCLNRSLYIGAVFGGCLYLLSGCASPPTKPQVTVDQVVAMAREGVPADSVIDKMSDSNSTYPLSASKLFELKQKGVPDEVLDYMEQTYLTEVCRQAIWDDRGHLYTARTIDACN